MNETQLIKKKFDLIVDMGEIIIANGGEIRRAYETMLRIAEYFKLDNFDTYIVANGIFTSITIREEYYSCQIRYTSMKPVCLARVEAVNSLSRDIEKRRLSVADIRNELQKITAFNASGDWLKIIAAGVSCGTFGYLFRGSPLDSVASMIAGLIMYLISLKVLNKLNFPKMMNIILCSAIAAGCCVILRNIGIGDNINHMIIGAIFPLVPGVSFTNGVRNLMDYEHLTGIIRLTDALITVTGTVIGVGLVLTLV